MHTALSRDLFAPHCTNGSLTTQLTRNAWRKAKLQVRMPDLPNSTPHDFLQSLRHQTCCTQLVARGHNTRWYNNRALRRCGTAVQYLRCGRSSSSTISRVAPIKVFFIAGTKCYRPFLWIKRHLCCVISILWSTTICCWRFLHSACRATECSGMTCFCS